MERKKEYPRVEFSATALQKIVTEFKDIITDPVKLSFNSLRIEKKKESWKYDTFEEFLAELDNEASYAYLYVTHPEMSFEITIWPASFSISTNVSISSPKRELILRLGNVVETAAENCFVPQPPEPTKELPKPKIFIGHGNSLQWRDLKDHLKDLHGYEVIAYETGSRAGHTIRDVIADMLDKASFAILVMTGEDDMSDGSIRARQNVIHELGLFQGRLGFTKAIVLKEDGTEEFSNINGVNQIRYTKGNIKETFGDIIAVLKREFGENR
jgi:predicted nucleotide-binding protein